MFCQYCLGFGPRGIIPPSRKDGETIIQNFSICDPVIVSDKAEPLLGLRFIPDDPPANYCVCYPGLWNIVRVYTKYVLRKYHNVSQEAGGKHALFTFGKFGKGAIRGVSADCLFDGHLLPGNPAPRILTIRCLTSDRRVDSEKRREWSHSPVRSKDQVRARVNQRTERISVLYAFRSDPLFGPAAIINRMVRLHRWNHSSFCESRDIGRLQVLSVLHSEPAIPVSIGQLGGVEVIQYYVVCLVSDRMHRALKARFVSIDDVLLEFALRNIIVGHQSRGVR